MELAFVSPVRILPKNIKSIDLRHETGEYSRDNRKIYNILINNNGTPIIINGVYILAIIIPYDGEYYGYIDESIYNAILLQLNEDCICKDFGSFRKSLIVSTNILLYGISAAICSIPLYIGSIIISAITCFVYAFYIGYQSYKYTRIHYLIEQYIESNIDRVQEYLSDIYNDQLNGSLRADISLFIEREYIISEIIDKYLVGIVPAEVRYLLDAVMIVKYIENDPNIKNATIAELYELNELAAADIRMIIDKIPEYVIDR